MGKNSMHSNYKQFVEWKQILNKTYKPKKKIAPQYNIMGEEQEYLIKKVGLRK